MYVTERHSINIAWPSLGKDYSFCLKLNREAFIFLVNIIQIIDIYIDHIFM